MWQPNPVPERVGKTSTASLRPPLNQSDVSWDDWDNAGWDDAWGDGWTMQTGTMRAGTQTGTMQTGPGGGKSCGNYTRSWSAGRRSSSPTADETLSHPGVAYRKLALECHPAKGRHRVKYCSLLFGEDKNMEKAKEMTTVFRKVKEAYEALRKFFESSGRSQICSGKVAGTESREGKKAMLAGLLKVSPLKRFTGANAPGLSRLAFAREGAGEALQSQRIQAK
ncbi:unnamed protein product [Symbiodinium natans]|uniref:J domain-containing protein n=1 Tax=Symbiodinium natans TaxID=878477 RepID=A0A812TC41_9DINO|nr:unnamed protein product [Symbiodinium natans]